jgi:SpoIVB peptidase S55
VQYCLKESIRLAIAATCCLAFLLPDAVAVTPKDDSNSSPPPPSVTTGFYPLDKVHRGLIATAYTVFEGTHPEPMQVEILGLLKNALGPNMDMILAKLKGAKPEYTGVVAGMSGSPVYVDGKLLGALSYRIGEFSKEPIAGITPISQMLEVQGGQSPAVDAKPVSETAMNLRPIDTPLVMTGFRPEAIKLWKDKFAGTSLETISAVGGVAGQGDNSNSDPLVPGSAVSALIIRGDLQIAATCTVTYVDPKQLLACGHPITQFGPVSMPMTKAEVLATLPSPLNAFKIINTSEEIGAFTDDRHSAIHGVFGEQARMIPVTLRLQGPRRKARELHFDVMDHQQITVTALLVGIYQSLLENNAEGTDSTYRLKAKIDVEGYAPVTSEALVAPNEQLPGNLGAALTIAERFGRLYTNPTRQNKVRDIKLEIEEIPQRLEAQLESARATSTTVHAGDTVTIEATLQPYQGAPRNFRIPVPLPASLPNGPIRLLVSDGATLDRILQPTKPGTHTLDLSSTIAQLQSIHDSDRLYVTMLLPSTQAGWEGRTLTSLPLSMANVLEPQRTAQDVVLNSESGIPVTSIPVDAVLTGQQVIMLHVQ